MQMPEPPSPNRLAEALLELIHILLQELRPEARVSVTLDSSMDRELGLDSLARIELLLRCEQQFGISLPEQLISTMETPRDLLRAILKADSTIQDAEIKNISTVALPEAEGEPSNAGTLIEALEWHVNAHPERVHVRLQDQQGEEEEIRYADLMGGAELICSGLRERGLLPGQSVALMLPTGKSFFVSLYGILMAGGIPVPIYPPMRLKQVEDHMRRQAGILSNAQAVLLITFEEIKPVLQLLKSQVESLQTIMTVKDLTEAAVKGERPKLNPNDIALLQYTSGSTGDPKGVVLTHANLLANIRAMGQAIEVTPKDVFVSWLPLYHDMGLIGACMGSMYYALPLILMSPLTFIAHPQRWLWAIHKYRGTLSSAPNFGYELCLRQKDDKEFEGLDLSSWRMAFNGAEPVSPSTIERFSSRFANYGFRPEAIAPVYGLAEASVGLAFPPPERGAVIDIIQREFMHHGRAIPAEADESNALRFVACGRPLAGHQIRIVDATGHEVAEREEGRLQFCGPSVTSGYFRNRQASAELFDGKWLDSGDYAYMAGGDIYLTGRAKDIIIRAGRNIYPQELEDAVGNIDGIRKGCIAVFASPDPKTGTERVVVMAETRKREQESLEQLRSEINDLSVDLLGAPPDRVELVPPNTVLKTSSGKIRRAANRQLFEMGGLSGRKPSSIKLQVLRLAASSLIPQCRRGLRVAGHTLYAGYAWLLFLLSASMAWIVTALLPGLTLRRRFIKSAASLFLRLSGTPLIVHGTEHLPKDEPYMLVANHASYLDGIMFSAALPPNIAYAVKQELREQFIPRLFLGRIGAEYVDRFDAGKGVADTSRMLNSIRSGESLALMPEGTFTRAPGLRPFYMGAFVIAAKAGVPVVPVAIRGTRSILRGSSFFPRRGIVSITIGEPIRPEGSEWSDAIKLRDKARVVILHHCGEPDLTGQGSTSNNSTPELPDG